MQAERKTDQQQTASPPHVALFVTCLVDLFRPSVAFATIKLLEAAGCRVSVPELQTCCGQPAYNSGARDDATAIVKQVVQGFESFDAVVVPSGSCAGMIRHHGPLLLADDPEWLRRVRAVAEKTYELTQFLATRAPDPFVFETSGEPAPSTVTYHDSCSCLREMGVSAEPRDLLAQIPGLDLRELDGREECCGFGGLFAVKYTDISNAMVTAKAESVAATKAAVLTGPDLGCLLNIAGKLKRNGSAITVRHVAEILAGVTTTAPIGDDAA